MLKFINVFRFFRGYVTFEASGGFPDNFLNSCKRSGITLFDIKKRDCAITASTFISDYKLMPCVRKDSDMQVHILSRRGIPFFIQRRRNRKGILIGVILFFIIMNLLSGRVWNIEVVGNSEVDANDIIDAYEALGITIGTRVGAVDLNKAEENAIENIPGIIWSAFNASGGLGVINVREGEPVPDLKNDEPPRNVVAKYGGQITKYEVYEGSAEQTENAAVTKGDLLISGVLTLTDGTTVLKTADGNVEAKTVRRVLSTLYTDFDLYSPSQIKKSHRISFFGIESPIFPWRPECDVLLAEGLEAYAVLGGVVLPIGMLSVNRIYFSKSDYWDGTIENGNRILSIGLDKYFRTHFEEMRESDILKSEISIVPSENGLDFVGEYESVENICEYSEIVYE